MEIALNRLMGRPTMRYIWRPYEHELSSISEHAAKFVMSGLNGSQKISWNSADMRILKLAVKLKMMIMYMRIIV